MKKLKKILCIALVTCLCIGGTSIISLAESIQDTNINSNVSTTETISEEENVIPSSSIESNVSSKAKTIPDNVNAVIIALNDIDSLQEMQDARSNYSDSESYELYKSNMFQAREDAKLLYDLLTDEEKLLVPEELVLKLTAELEDYWVIDKHPDLTRKIYQGNGDYIWQVVNTYRNYERSNHINKAGNVSAIMILVDSSSNTGDPWEWKPYPLNDLWDPNISNYELVYCTDMETTVIDGVHYKRTNLEDAEYYSDENARYIRSILTNSYPFISIDEMKNKLIAGGMDKNIVDKLDRSDIIAAVQYSIWFYSNNATNEDIQYGKTKTVSNDKIFHGHSNEIWYWYDTNNGSYVDEANTKVTALVDYLTKLDSIEPDPEQIVIDSIIVEEAQAIEDLGETYNVSLKVKLNGVANSKSDLKLTAETSVDKVEMQLDDSNDYTLNIKAKNGEKINIKVDGIQYLPYGVYLYDPEGGRDTSQSLVGISNGFNKILVEDSTEFNEEIPIVPDDEETPPDPDDEKTPDDTEEPGIGDNDIIQTGDNSLNMIWFIIASLISLGVFIILSTKKSLTK